jgi:hypothetical protein
MSIGLVKEISFIVIAVMVVRVRPDLKTLVMPSRALTTGDNAATDADGVNDTDKRASLAQQRFAMETEIFFRALEAIHVGLCPSIRLFEYYMS